MKKKRTLGFTIIELMIALITGSIVIFAAGMMLFASHRSWKSVWDKVNMQRDASYALQQISQITKSGKFAELENDDTAVKIYRQNDWIRFYFDNVNGHLKCEYEGEAPQNCIEGNVLDLLFDIAGSTIMIDLTLQNGSQQIHYTSAIMMRNYEA